MNRLISLALVFCMIFALFAGCGKQEPAEPGTSSVGSGNTSQIGSTTTPLAPNPTPDTPTPSDPNPDDGGKTNTTPSDLPAEQGASSGGSSVTTPSDVPTAPNPTPDTPAPSDPPPAEPTPTESEGGCKQGISDEMGWVSQWADMQFTVPTSFEMDTNFPGNSTANTRSEMQAYSTTGSAEAIQIYIIEPDEAFKTADDYLQSYRDNATGKLTDTEDMVIAGRTFRHFRSVPENTNFASYAYAATIIDDYVLYIIISYRDTKTVSRLYNCFSRISDRLKTEVEIK